MAQVSRVLLFVSTASTACAAPLQLVSQSGAPVEVVRLDTAWSRQAALRGRYFQILSVPTLVLLLSDSNVQLFTGAQKAMSVLNDLLSPPATAAPADDVNFELVGQEQPTRQEGGVRRRKPKKRQKGGKKRSTDLGDRRHDQRDRRRGRTQVRSRSHARAKQKKGTGKGVYKKAYARKESSSDPDTSEGDYISEEDVTPMELSFDETALPPNRPPPPPTQGLMVGPANSQGPSNSNIMEMAKRMEAERKQTLGYNEEDLPRGRF